MTDWFFLVIGLVVASALLFKAYRSREQWVYHVIGALGWAVLALSGLTDGLLEIAIIVVAAVILVSAIVLRRNSTEDAQVA